MSIKKKTLDKEKQITVRFDTSEEKEAFQKKARQIEHRSMNGIGVIANGGRTLHAVFGSLRLDAPTRPP